MMLVKEKAEIRRMYCELDYIEECGRLCYKSKPGEQLNRAFIQRLIYSKHESVIEHGFISVQFTCDRGISHELVRHRLASFSQESTRYCNYNKDRAVTFIIPPWIDVKPGKYLTIDSIHDLHDKIDECALKWMYSCFSSEHDYIHLISKGWKAQQARSVLNHSVKTEVILTANLREWRHIFQLRYLGLTGSPHPQMMSIMKPLLEQFKMRVPIIFDDIKDV